MAVLLCTRASAVLLLACCLEDARLAELREGAVVAAPQSGRRYRLTREQVFGRR